MIYVAGIREVKDIPLAALARGAISTRISARIPAAWRSRGRECRHNSVANVNSPFTLFLAGLALHHHVPRKQVMMRAASRPFTGCGMRLIAGDGNRPTEIIIH